MAIGYLIGLRKVCAEEQYIEEEFEKAEQAKLAKKREDSQNFSREDIEDDWDGLDIEEYLFFIIYHAILCFFLNHIYHHHFLRFHLHLHLHFHLHLHLHFHLF